MVLGFESLTGSYSKFKYNLVFKFGIPAGLEPSAGEAGRRPRREWGSKE